MTSTKRPVQTLASSFIFLLICSAIVLSTLAYGTVHYWALAVFELSAALIAVLWCVDAWRSRLLRFSMNPLQLPLFCLILVGLIQLLPFGRVDVDSSAISVAPLHSLSVDPYSTRMVLVQIASLLLFFAATLAFTDSPARFRTLVRTIMVFGFCLAIFGLIQSFTSPTKVYWIRDLTQSTPFGPFINRHHFAGYMEMTLALPLGLLFAGAVEREKRSLFIFAVAVMGVALILTNSRGGIISLVAEIAFLVIASGLRRSNASESPEVELPGKGLVFSRVFLGIALIAALFVGVLLVGGGSVLDRFAGTISSSDPTTGRAHFWGVAVSIIEDHPVIGAGLGSFGLSYTRYDSRNGLLRLEQAHNDYLQILTDAGVLGGIIGLAFVVLLFRRGFARRGSNDLFRSGVALGAMAGCFAVLVHSFFDFTLHTTSNALLFLVLAALATMDGRIEARSVEGRRHHRPRQENESLSDHVEQNVLVG